MYPKKIRRDRGLPETDIIKIMRRNLKSGGFKLGRKRGSGRGTKHENQAKYLRQEVEEI